MSGDDRRLRERVKVCWGENWSQGPLKRGPFGNSLAVQRLGLCALTAEGPGSIPGRGNKISQAAQRGQKKKGGGFPGGAAVENLPANAGDTGSSPGLGRSHMPRSN